jgi:hypothetical protein
MGRGGSDPQSRRSVSWSARASALAGVLIAAAVGASLIGGSAAAQLPPVCLPSTIYCIPTPTPTPTPTPSGTPFQSSGPTTAPQQPQHGPRLMRPFPRIRTKGKFTRSRTTFTRIAVRAPRGTTLEARCSRKRCKRTRRTIGGATVRLRALERSYRPGTILRILVFGDSEIGKYVDLRTRRGKPPVRRDRCLPPRRRRPSRCRKS